MWTFLSFEAVLIAKNAIKGFFASFFADWRWAWWAGGLLTGYAFAHVQMAIRAALHVVK